MGNAGASSLTRAQAGFSGFLGILGRVSAALGGVGFAAAATGSIRLAANLEQATIAFTTMLGSGEKAKAFLDDLANFAASTPFEFTGLQQSSRLLLAFGFEAQNILPIMGRVGDAVAALGGGEAEINRVVRALGQIQAKGKLSAEELMQIAELGIPAYQILQEKLGLTSKQLGDIGNQGISSATAINALLEGLAERYSGSMAAQSQTLNGLFSTLRDNVTLTLTDLGTRAVEALNLKDVVQRFIGFTGNIRTALEQGGISGLLGQYKDQLGLIAAVIAGPVTVALAGMVATAAPALAAVAGLSAAGVALYLAWKSNFLGLGDLVNSTLSGIREGIGSVVERINGSYGSLDNYKARWGEAFSLVAQKANEWYEGTRSAVQNSLDALRGSNPKAASYLSGLGEMFGKTVQAIGNAFVQLPNYIIATVNSANELGTAFARIFGEGGIGLILKGFGTLLWGYVVEPFQNLVAPVAEAAARVGQVVSNWASKVATFFKPFTDFLRSIGRSIGDAFGTVASTTVSSLTDELKTGISDSAATLATFTATSSTVQRGFAEVHGGLGGIVNAASDAQSALGKNLSDLQANSQQAADAGSNLAAANTEVATTANDAAGGAINLAKGTAATGDAADAAAEAEKRLKKAVEERTKDAQTWVTRLNDEVVTGGKTAAQAAELILPVYDRVKANMARMLESGVYDGEEYLVAKGRLEILEQALTTFTGTAQELKIPDVSATLDLTVRAAKDAQTAVYGAADANDNLSETLLRARKLSGELNDGEKERIATLRAADTSAETLSETLTRLNNQSRIAGQYFQDAETGANDFSTALAELNAKAADAARTQSGPEDFSTSLGDLNTLSQYAQAEERAAEAKQKITDATSQANSVVKDEGDLVGQTKQQLDSYIESLNLLLQNLTALKRANPELAANMGLNDVTNGLRDARDAAQAMREEVEQLSQTKGGLRALGTVFEGLAGMAGGGTFAGMLAGLGAGAQAAAGEVQNINDGLKAIDEGDFSGGMQGILGAAQKVLAAIKSGFEQVLGEDLPAEANIGFEAVNGALGGAAAGAIFGPWGAVIGGVLGGIMGLFTGITAEQKKWTEEAKKTAEALGESANALSKRRDSAQRTDLETNRMNLEQQHDSGALSDADYFAKRRDLDNQGALLDYGDSNQNATDFYNTERNRLQGLPQTPQVQQQLADLDQQRNSDLAANKRQYDAQIRQNNTKYSNDVNDSNQAREDQNAKFKVKPGSLEALENEKANAQTRQKQATSAGEYNAIQNEIDGFQRQIDEITGAGVGSAIKGNLDWYEGEIAKLKDKQGKATTPQEYAQLQTQIDTYNKQMDKIKGVGAGSAAGSIAYYNDLLSEKRKEFDETVDKGTRASLGAEITQLETTIAELQKAGEAGKSILDTIRETFKLGTEDFAGTFESAMHAADFESFTDNFHEALRKKITDAIIQGQNDAADYQGLSDMASQALADGTVTQSELDALQTEADRVAESKRGTFDLLDSLTLFGDKLSDTAGGMSDLNAELSNVPSGLKLARMRYSVADAVEPAAPPAVTTPTVPAITQPDTSQYTLSAQVGKETFSISDPSTMNPRSSALNASVPDLSLSTQAGAFDISARLENVLRDIADNGGMKISEAKFYGVTDVGELFTKLEQYKGVRSGRQSGSTASR